jgi:hypothetical protein
MRKNAGWVIFGEERAPTGVNAVERSLVCFVHRVDVDYRCPHALCVVALVVVIPCSRA